MGGLDAVVAPYVRPTILVDVPEDSAALFAKVDTSQAPLLGENTASLVQKSSALAAAVTPP